MFVCVCVCAGNHNMTYGFWNICSNVCISIDMLTKMDEIRRSRCCTPIVVVVGNQSWDVPFRSKCYMLNNRWFVEIMLYLSPYTMVF